MLTLSRKSRAQFAARRVNHRPRLVQDVATEKRGKLASGARPSLSNTEVDPDRQATAHAPPRGDDPAPRNGLLSALAREDPGAPLLVHEMDGEVVPVQIVLFDCLGER